jgi:hypothetical protein
VKKKTGGDAHEWSSLGSRRSFIAAPKAAEEYHGDV